MDIERAITMEATLSPDCYGGKSCAQIEPRWYGYCQGDKDGDYSKDIALASDTFPPGTRVTIQEPVCPKCCEVPTRSRETETFQTEDGDQVTEYRWSCGCDFSWRDFALDHYS